MSELLALDLNQWNSAIDALDDALGGGLKTLTDQQEIEDTLLECCGIEMMKWVNEEQIMFLAFIDYHHASAFSRHDFK